MSKLVKSIIFSALLITASYFFGWICRYIGQAYVLLISPSWTLLNLLVWFLLATGAMAMSAGIVAVLLRPAWLGILIFAFSGLSMLTGWQVSSGGTILILFYIAASMIYYFSVVNDLGQRIKFSLQSVSGNQGTLIMALLIVACGSLYFSAKEYIGEQGFSIPEAYVQVLMEQVEKPILSQVPEDMQPQVRLQLRHEFRHRLNSIYEDKLRQYEHLVPLAVAVMIFMLLMPVLRLFSWIPVIVLKVLFALFTWTGITKIITDTAEVKKLVID